MSPAQAAAAGAKTLVIGIAPPGGPAASGLASHLDRGIECGVGHRGWLHQRIGDIPEIAACAAKLAGKFTTCAAAT